MVKVELTRHLYRFFPDLEGKELEDHPHRSARHRVTDNRTGDRSRDKGPRQHELSDRDQVHPDHDQPGEQGAVDRGHVRLSSGTAFDEGTACAVTSTPAVAIAVR